MVVLYGCAIELFTTFKAKKDVWSFGVTSYEVMTKGMTPYIGMSLIQEVRKFAIRGGRLQKPLLPSPEILACGSYIWCLCCSRSTSGHDSSCCCSSRFKPLSVISTSYINY